MREFLDAVHTYPWTALYATLLLSWLLGTLRIIVRRK